MKKQKEQYVYDQIPIMPEEPEEKKEDEPTETDASQTNIRKLFEVDFTVNED